MAGDTGTWCLIESDPGKRPLRWALEAEVGRWEIEKVLGHRRFRCDEGVAR